MNRNINKVWTEKDIRSYMKSFVNNSMDGNDRMIIGDIINTIPIAIDGRLKSSLGYFSGKYKRSGEFVEPVKFKFSKRINAYNDDTIKHIINHELLHLLSDKKHKRNTSHNKEWKELCCKYKINDDEFFTPNLELEKDYHRYHIYCAKCGKLIATKDRLSKAGIIDLLLYGKHTIDYGTLKIFDNKEDKYLDLNNVMANDCENY